jgi:hypothetical protein
MQWYGYHMTYYQYSPLHYATGEAKGSKSYRLDITLLFVSWNRIVQLLATFVPRVTTSMINVFCWTIRLIMTNAAISTNILPIVTHELDIVCKAYTHVNAMAITGLLKRYAVRGNNVIGK